MIQKDKTLYMDRYSSKCGHCGKPAYAHDKNHYRIAGYMGYGMAPRGCGVEWKYVTSIVVSPGIEKTIKQLRPDLEYIDTWLS